MKQSAHNKFKNKIDNFTFIFVPLWLTLTIILAIAVQAQVIKDFIKYHFGI